MKVKHGIVEAAALAVVMLTTVVLVVVYTEYRAAKFALPGDRLIVFFPEEASAAGALRTIGGAGAVMTEPLGAGNAYRVLVLRGGAASALAREAWVFRDPIAAVAECFGYVTPAARALRRI